MLNGALTGVASVCFTLPFQVLSTKMKVKKNPDTKFTEIIREIYQSEGIKGFYRGLFPNLIRAPLRNGVFFPSLSLSHKFLIKRGVNKNLTYFLSSAFAMSMSCLLINPIVVISTRKEASTSKEPNKSIGKELIEIKNNEGYKGLFKGIKPLLIKEVPSRSLFYLLFRVIDNQLNKIPMMKGNKRISPIISLPISCIIVTMLDNPFDLLRTQEQVERQSGQRKNVLGRLKKIYKNEGIRGLERGVTPNLLKRVTSYTVTWVIYNFLSNYKDL